MRTRWLVAALTILVGLVWIGQGTGVIAGKSFMTGDGTWAAAGAVLVLIGAIIAAFGVIRRPGA
jgi:hypothetical protein